MDWSCTSIQAKPAQLFTVRYVIFSCQGNGRGVSPTTLLVESAISARRFDSKGNGLRQASTRCRSLITQYCMDHLICQPIGQEMLTIKAEPASLSFFWLKLSRLSSPLTGRVEITQHQRRMDIIASLQITPN